MSGEDSNILPCPFCFSTRPMANSGLNQYDEVIYYIFCRSCNARGPVQAKLDNAVRDWNEASR